MPNTPAYETKTKTQWTSSDLQFKELSLTKQKTRPGQDYKWIGKLFRSIVKNSDPMSIYPMRTTSPLARKQILFKNCFALLYVFYSSVKEFQAAQPPAFLLKTRGWQKHHFNLTSKIMKMSEHILKRQQPNTIQILWIVKTSLKSYERCNTLSKNTQRTE